MKPNLSQKMELIDRKTNRQYAIVLIELKQVMKKRKNKLLIIKKLNYAAIFIFKHFRFQPFFSGLNFSSKILENHTTPKASFSPPDFSILTHNGL